MPLFHVTVSGSGHAYQYTYPEDFNADTLVHVSVSVKRICLFNLTLNSVYIISLSFTYKFNTFYQKRGESKLFLLYICVPLQEYDILVADYGFDI